jgi:uncharacterized membrane protein YjgN (DUF898 family)
MGVFDVEPIRRQPLPGEDPALVAAEVQPEPPELPFDADPDLQPTGPLVDVSFTGDAAEYFRIWIICSLLSLLTLSLYRPWAKLRLRRYIASHWHIHGARFDVTYDPWVNLRGRLLVIVAALASLVLAFGWPMLQPIVVLLAFAVAPWLITQSNRFNWQSLRMIAGDRVLHLGFWGRSNLLCKPLLMLGAGLAVLTLGYGVFSDVNIGTSLMVFLTAYLLVFVLLYPRASSFILYQKFAYGKLGKTRFTFYGSPKDVIAHLFKASFSGSFISLIVGLVILQMLVQFFVRQPDLRAVSLGLIYLMLTVASVSFARTRRLNFVIHRLQIGGLSFSSTLQPVSNALRVSTYAVLAVITLGLSIPWSTIRYHRWRSYHLFAYMQGDWSKFEALTNAPVKGTALEELAQQFNFDLGL